MERRRVVRFILIVVAIFAVMYLVQQSWWFVRQHSYDKQIAFVAGQYDISPYLVKAVVWRESRFNRLSIGKAGEVGLMQLMPGAAKEWADAHNLPPPSRADLFDAKTNLEAGSWYLKRALNRWKDCDDPVPFALAEYNAGRSNVIQWRAKMRSPHSAREFVPNIGIASTRRYVQDVMAIQTKLERRGRL
jgi:soluble lytic murein transglycosylase